MSQRARTFKVNCCLKVHNAHLNLLSLTSESLNRVGYRIQLYCDGQKPYKRPGRLYNVKYIHFVFRNSGEHYKKFNNPKFENFFRKIKFTIDFTGSVGRLSGETTQ